MTIVAWSFLTADRRRLMAQRADWERWYHCDAVEADGGGGMIVERWWDWERPAA